MFALILEVFVHYNLYIYSLTEEGSICLHDVVKVFFGHTETGHIGFKSHPKDWRNLGLRSHDPWFTRLYHCITEASLLA